MKIKCLDVFFFKSGFSDVESRLTAAPIHNSNTLFTSMNAHIRAETTNSGPARAAGSILVVWRGYQSDGSSCFLPLLIRTKGTHTTYTHLAVCSREPSKGGITTSSSFYAAQSHFTHPPALFRLFSGNTNVFAPFLPPSPPPSPLPLP